ncbi:hypothetical protein EVAR_31921_1 [Eumeta japonica]|uniref:Uncharacterized protein n=1 Tax=Eumeta variegata TaxID=151549 RepID=A0A4C1XRK4_EUMVA|nr:hypothetical protein EVAR_31921_1 [Eumeta japonica]
MRTPQLCLIKLKAVVRIGVLCPTSLSTPCACEASLTPFDIPTTAPSIRSYIKIYKEYSAFRKESNLSQLKPFQFHAFHDTERPQQTALRRQPRRFQTARQRHGAAADVKMSKCSISKAAANQ